MRISCLFFAAYRDVFEAEQIEFELPEGSTLGELIEDVRARAGTAALPRQLVAAVNREYAPTETVLHNGDEVAFIPPVAGG
ncbi:MAG: molybdopterin converting factor subunit 1 [Gemmatimonadales bacterium]|jgi:molybdopterin converting factor subunit 1